MLRLRLPLTMAPLLVCLGGSSARAAPDEPAPPPDVISADPLQGAPGVAIGYSAYAGMFYDMGVTFELASWPTDGAEQVTLSGVTYEENKGLLTNLLMMILAMGGGPSGEYVQRNGRVEYDPGSAGKFRQEYVDSIAAGAASLPFSLGVRAYHDAFGSDMTGWALDLGFGRTLGDPTLGRGAWVVSLSAGSMSTNRRGAPAIEPVPGMPPMERVTYHRGWFGASLDLRIGVSGLPWLGGRMKVTAAFSDPFLLLVEAGPELHLGNRLHLRALATSDVAGFATDAIGARLEGVVRF